MGGSEEHGHLRECLLLMMDLIIKMTNYSIKVSAKLGDTCKIKKNVYIITYIALRCQEIKTFIKFTGEGFKVAF